jgi:GAF domain-containing protein
VEDWRSDGESMYDLLERQNIRSLLAIPMAYNGQLIGYLCADNYRLEETVDAQKILETVSLFAASKIANHRLMG